MDCENFNQNASTSTGLQFLSREAEEMVRNLEYATSDVSEDISCVGSPALENTDTDSTGSGAPNVDVVKEELRNRIKSRRVAKGLDENPELTAKRPRIEHLTEEEEEKRRIRRERNKLAAMKCRQRRKEHIQELTEETEGLEGENVALEREILCLREQKKQLETMLINHACCLRKTPQDRNNNGGASSSKKDTLTLLIRSSSESSCSSEAAKSNGSITPDSPNKSIGAC